MPPVPITTRKIEFFLSPTEDPYKGEPVPKLPFEEHPHPYKEESVPKLPLESHPYKEEPAVLHGRNGKRRNRRTR